MTLLQHAESVLKNADRVLTSHEVVAGYTPPKGGKTPNATFVATISVAKDKLSIKRVGPNLYCHKDKEQELRQKEISVLAYSLWEKAGKPISNGVEFWLQAESMLTAKWNRV